MSRSSQLTVQAALRKQYTKVMITVVDDTNDLKNLASKRPDLVVPGMKILKLDPSKGFGDNSKIWLSDFLNENGICFTGSDKNAMCLEMNKPLAKQQVLNAGLQTPQYFISTLETPSFEHKLAYPLFVKPTSSGGSKGIDEKSVVYTQAELESKISSLHTERQSDVLVEEYLPGREFSVAVVRQPFTNDLLAMPIEIIAPADSNGKSFLSVAVKSADSEKTIAVPDSKLSDSIKTLAINVFETLGARDYGRIDIRLNSKGIPSFIEANLMPGLSTHGYLARCLFTNQGISYGNMILSIVDLSARRLPSLQVIKARSQLSMKASGRFGQLADPIV